MSPVIFRKTYEPPPLCEKEILRYAGCRAPDENVSALLADCVRELCGQLCCAVCCCALPVSLREGCCDFGVFSVRSEKLACNLRGCRRVLLFAATVGVGLDRLIARYGRLSPARALLFQAIGAERIEALCDAFCDEAGQALHTRLRPRFSPGYGDLPLTVQKEIFAVLDCPRQIGLSLTDSLLMSPSKSVTAFAGIEESPTGDGQTDRPRPHTNRCSTCEKQDCSFRGAL